MAVRTHAKTVLLPAVLNKVVEDISGVVEGEVQKERKLAVECESVI